MQRHRFPSRPSRTSASVGLGFSSSNDTAAITIPAVQSAVIDAVSHLGVRHIDMPATPEKVWRAIQGANGSAG